MAIYKCQVCVYIYDEAKEGVKWGDFPCDWVCAVCESGKAYYQPVDESESKTDTVVAVSAEKTVAVDELIRTSDEIESYMADIHQMAETGESIIEPMRTKRPTCSWDDILIKGAQLAKISLNHSDAVNVQTVISKKARHPLVIESAIFVTHMSFGAISREAKIALAKGSAAVKTAMCSGEGGILPDSLENSYKYIFEYVPNKYSVSEENLKKVDAIGTTALMAIGCQQYRICNTGKCPMGITTHNPEFRPRFDVERSAKQLENLLRVSTEELKDFARLTGYDDVHKLSITDLCTTNSEISNHTEIEHV